MSFPKKSLSGQTHTSSAQSSTPVWYRHVPKNLLLIFLSIITAPISIALVLFCLIYTRINPTPKPIALPSPLHRHEVNEQSEENADSDSLRQKTILVTGISMTKGLVIIRLLSQHTPHRIICADISSVSPGRFSSATSAFYRLTPPDGGDAEPYIDSLLNVIQLEKVDLWISCSSVVAAVEDGVVVRLADERAKANGSAGFRAIQFREDVVETLHEKDRFIEYIQSLGLRVPESHRCTSREEVLQVLLPDSEPESSTNQNQREGQDKGGVKYILKPIGVDDRARAAMMTLLPFSSPQETTSYVNNLTIEPQNPFQLQQFIQGDEYCTHALIVRGRVVAFTACPSSELLMHYCALPSNSRLSKAMLAFTQRVAEDGGEDFTGHLSFDFLVPSTKSNNNGINSGANKSRIEEDEDGNLVIYPIECNPRAHTAIALFADTPALSSAYLSVFSPPSSLDVRDIVTPAVPTQNFYWIGHDLVTLLILPVLDAAWGMATVDDVLKGWIEFGEHVLAWCDGTFDVSDPIPFAVLYHVYWPLVFMGKLWQGREWSRINVSTTKVFDG